MSKAGKGDSVDTGSVGSQHPVPENIPHLSSPNGQNGGGANGNTVIGQQHHPGLHGQNGGSGAAGTGPQVTASGSPVKESSFLHRETSVDEGSAAAEGQQNKTTTTNVSSSPISPENAGMKGIPIRR